MQSVLPDNVQGVGEDGLTVLLINALTGYAKGWLEDFLAPNPKILAFVRRGYVLLPVLCAGVICVMESGFNSETFACTIKYGVLASYVKAMHRTTVQGR